MCLTKCNGGLLLGLWLKLLSSDGLKTRISSGPVLVLSVALSSPLLLLLCCLDGDEEPAVTVAYDSDNGNEVGPDGGKQLKSGRLRRRRSSQLNSAASYRSVDNRSHQLDPSLRCISVSSATQWFVRVRTCSIKNLQLLCRFLSRTKLAHQIELIGRLTGRLLGELLWNVMEGRIIGKLREAGGEGYRC